MIAGDSAGLAADNKADRFRREVGFCIRPRFAASDNPPKEDRKSCPCLECKRLTLQPMIEEIGVSFGPPFDGSSAGCRG